MSTKENKVLVRSWYDVSSVEEWLCQRPEFKNLETTETEKLKIVMPVFFVPKFTTHLPEGNMSFESFVQYQILRLKAFPDFSCRVEDVIAER